jgi:phospholipase/carboxylesterase
MASRQSRHTSSLFFLHGSGDSAWACRRWVQALCAEFGGPEVKLVFPDAPVQPYTLARGAPVQVWFDRTELALDAPEALASVEAACTRLEALVTTEIDSGIGLSVCVCA